MVVLCKALGPVFLLKKKKKQNLAQKCPVKKGKEVEGNLRVRLGLIHSRYCCKKV